MIRKLILAIGLLTLVGCSSKPQNEQSLSALGLSDGELLKDKWKDLNRFAARYPLSAAKSGKAGCATVEYVITPEYEIRDIVVVNVSDKVFSKSSKSVISNWKWSDLPKGLIASAVKTRTRFDFCVESKGASCAEVIKSFSCEGVDSISSLGTIVRRRG